MVKCQHCGTQNRSDATYCNSCGYALKGATVVHPAASAARSRTAGPLHPTGRLPAQSHLAGVYIINGVVGQGGMAAVYQATDIRNSSQVAIKEMSQDSLAPSELKEALESFVQEAELLMGLRHKGLPRVSGHFSEGSRHYLVMEYIEGKTLEQRLTAAGGKPLPERDVLAWADQICDVLTYLHSRRPPIIFRDLKPANIMVTASGRIKLIDFGIARVFVPGRTRDTQVLGTPGFAPPEQYGKAQTDPRADVYALGCTLYQLLSGYDPASTPFALPPLNSRNPSISPYVQVAIERATKLDRESRFRSVADFQRMLLHPEGMYFRTGECAHSLRELVALCQAHPQEAAEHLYARRFDPWLSRWGERQAVKAVLTSTMRTTDQAAGLTAFLKLATAPAASAGTAASARPSAQPTHQRSSQSARGATTHAASAAPSATASLVTVQPRTIDFGQLKSGQSGTVSITIRGQNGANVNGQIISPHAWVNPLVFNSGHPGPFFQVAQYYNSAQAYPEGTYVIKITDECGRTATQTFTTSPIVTSPPSVLYLPGCELGQGSVMMRINEAFQNVFIQSAPPGFGQTLPYNVSQNIHVLEPNYFSMNSLPAGTYVFRIVDTCNRSRLQTITITGYQINSDEVTITEHCSSFDVYLRQASNGIANNFWLQKFNAQLNRWEHPLTGGFDGATPNNLNSLLLNNNMNNVNLNTMGQFRVVHAFSVFGNGTEVYFTCENVIREFEYQSGPEIENIYSYSCSNSSLDVIVDAVGADPLQYRITMKDGSPFVINNNNSPMFTGLQPGIYNFQIEDACGNILNRVYDISTPVSFSIMADNLCNGQTGSLVVPYFSFLNYEWWKGNNTGTILSTSNVLTLPNFNLTGDSGVYHVRITNSGNPNSCMNKVLDFTVSNQLSTPQAGMGSNVNLCGSQGTINLFSYLSGNYDNFGTWEETSSSGMLINHLWNASGITSGVYTFKYSVEGLCNMRSEAIVQISVNPIPQSPEPSGDTAVCEGESLHLFASDVPGVTYQWTGPNGFSSNDQNPVLDAITVSNQGTYTVTAIQNGCVSAADSVEVTVDSLPYFSVKDACQNDMTILTATMLNPETDPSSLTFTWTYPDGTIHNSNPINVSGGATGLYSLTVTGPNGCSVTDTFPLACTNCGIPRGISPNNDGLNENFDLSCLTGITNVKIFNRYGINVFEKEGYVNDWSGKDFNGNLLPTGTYYYVVKFDTGDAKTGWVYLNY